MPIKLENYKERLIDKTIDLYLKTFKAIQIVGPKWCGKTWTSMHPIFGRIIDQYKKIFY